MTVLPSAPELAPDIGLVTVPPRLKVAAGASVVVGCIYLVAVPSQLERFPPYALVFLGIALGQARLAGALLRRTGTTALLAGIFGNLAVAGMYLQTRTAGLPFGPVRRLGHHAHVLHTPVAGGVGNGVPILPLISTRVEAVGVLDLATIGVQFGVVVILVTLLPTSARRWTTNTMGACGLALWALAWQGVLG